MTKSQMKVKARSMLLLNGTNAFVSFWEWPPQFALDFTDKQKHEFSNVMSKELERVEKLFGFVPGSFER